MNAVKRNKQGGFTLIELAIVLVIIGLILGAILKGQDLIVNARAKKYASWIKSWEVQQLTHLDRKGRYAGDAELIGSGVSARRGNGTIGDNTSSDSTFVNEITSAAGFIDVPPDQIALGNFLFFMHMGYNTLSARKANVIVVTTSANNAQIIVQDELPYMEMFDAVIDGTAQAASGRVRAITAATLSARVVTGVSHATAADWAAGQKGLVYYFDRNPDSLE